MKELFFVIYRRVEKMFEFCRVIFLICFGEYVSLEEWSNKANDVKKITGVAGFLFSNVRDENKKKQKKSMK